MISGLDLTLDAYTMNPNHKPFACATYAGTTPFMWLIAGPQKAATNDPKFNEVSNEVTLIKKEKDQ